MTWAPKQNSQRRSTPLLTVPMIVQLYYYYYEQAPAQQSRRSAVKGKRRKVFPPLLCTSHIWTMKHFKPKFHWFGFLLLKYPRTRNCQKGNPCQNALFKYICTRYKKVPGLPDRMRYVTRAHNCDFREEEKEIVSYT